METETINNAQLTSSSYYNKYGQFQAWNGRLNNDKYWATATEHPQDDWIQVDLLDIFTVIGIITQGGQNKGYREWVEELQIQYGRSEGTLSYILEDGKPKVSTLLKSKHFIKDSQAHHGVFI